VAHESHLALACHWCNLRRILVIMFRFYEQKILFDQRCSYKLSKVCQSKPIGTLI
jgi:hypothetical protein